MMISPRISRMITSSMNSARKPPARGDEEVVDVPDRVQLAPDALLPLSQMEARGGQPVDPGEILVADQLEGVVRALEEARGLDLQLADLADGPRCRPPLGDDPPRRLPHEANQLEGALEVVVQAVVDVAEFQKLHVGEFEGLERVRDLAVRDERRGPVDHDQVVGGVGQLEAGGLDDLGLREGLVLQADQARDPARPLPHPIRPRLVHLEDDVFLAEFAEFKVDDRRREPLDPGLQVLSGGDGQLGEVGQAAGEAGQFLVLNRQAILGPQRDRAEVEDRELGIGGGDRLVAGEYQSVRLQDQPQGGGSVADRFRSPRPPDEDLRIGGEQLAREVQLDLIPDVEGEEEVDRNLARHWLPRIWWPKGRGGALPPRPDESCCMIPARRAIRAGGELQRGIP
jgi:hypothetical protein